MRLGIKQAVASLLLLLCFAATLSDGAKSPDSYIETLDTKQNKSGRYYLLSIDEKYNHLLVGARDHAFLVDLDNFKNIKSWTLPETAKKKKCEMRHVDLCHHVVTILLPFKEGILLCWSGDLKTRACFWRNRKNLKNIASSDNKTNSFSTDELEHYYSFPGQNDTAIITEHGRLFSGTYEPYSVIYAVSIFTKPKLGFARTSKDSKNFYGDAHFVKSFDIGHYVYFFFRERWYEVSSFVKMKISRVARICKGDNGGGRFGLEKRFVTFQKARLTCSDGERFPLHFNEIQDVWWDEQTNLFHTIFITHPGGPPSSAICVYSLSDINRVFDKSDFKSYDRFEKKWTTVKNNYTKYFKNCKVNSMYTDRAKTARVPEGMMATNKLTFKVIRNLLHDPLMKDPVKPRSFNSKYNKDVPVAWFIKEGIRMTAIALDRVGHHTVVYTSTGRGTVLKISKPAGVHRPCLLDELVIFPSSKGDVVKAMAIDTKRHVLYFGSNTTLTKLTLKQCRKHAHQSSCVSAADPYCAWDKETRRCVSALSHGNTAKLKQNLTTCPQLTKVNEWSPWKSCIQSDGNFCRCKVRPCKTSACHGGYEVRLENCTVDVSVGWEGKEAWKRFGVQHGGWSSWGTWSECSADPWAGMKHRNRTCSDPVPKRGGRPCVGESTEYKLCKEKKQGTEKHGTKKQGSEKQGTEKHGAEKHGTGKQGAEKHGTEKNRTEEHGTEKQGTEKSGAEKQGAEKQGAEKHGTEKNGTEKQGAEKHGTEKNGTKKHGTEKQGAEKQGTEKHGTEKNGTEEHVHGLGKVNDSPPSKAVKTWVFLLVALSFVLIFL